MGKKSVENLQEPNADSDNLTPPHSIQTFELDQHEGPVEALQPRDQNQKTLQRLLHSSWRAGDRAKHLQEVSLQLQTSCLWFRKELKHMVTFLI